jgi:hypothetical protein
MIYFLLAHSLPFLSLSLSLPLSLLVSHGMDGKFWKVADATLESRLAWPFVFEAWGRESSLARAAYVVGRVNWSLAIFVFCSKK